MPDLVPPPMASRSLNDEEEEAIGALERRDLPVTEEMRISCPPAPPKTLGARCVERIMEMWDEDTGRKVDLFKLILEELRHDREWGVK